MTVISADTAVLNGLPTGPGWVRCADGVITEVGTGRAPEPPTLHAAVLAPGFVDLHMHGGGGHDASRSATDLAGAVAWHRRHGTTATLISLMSAPVDQLCMELKQVAAVAAASDSGVLGAHLEGPFLSQVQCGAQHPAHLISPDLAVLHALVEAADGKLRSITIAPELPGALDVIDAAVEAGVVVAVGHTDASYGETRAAFDHGATLVTHLYNGMRTIHHRDPGPVPAAFDAGAICEVINDGAHVDPAMVRLADRSTRLVLVTDAIAASGDSDGEYVLGGQRVWVRDGIARLDAGGLAGSTLTMDAAVRRAVRDGLSLEHAVRAATRTPAEALGISDTHGVIAVGRRADLVLLTDRFEVDVVLTADLS